MRFQGKGPILKVLATGGDLMSNNDKYSVDKILKDAEEIKVKVIKRESEQQSKYIGKKMSVIKSNMKKESEANNKNVIKKLVSKGKIKNKDIYSTTGTKVKLSVTNPLDILPIDDTENIDHIHKSDKIESKPPPSKTENKNDLKEKSSANHNMANKNKEVLHFEHDEILEYKRALKMSQSKTNHPKNDNSININSKPPKKRFSFSNNIKAAQTSNIDFPSASEFNDYTCRKDVHSIKKTNISKCKTSFLQTLAISIIMLICIAPPILLRFFPDILQSLNISNINIIYSSINLGASILCIIICFSIIKNGLVGIFRFKGNVDSAVSIAIISTAIQASVSFINLNRFGETKVQLSTFTGIAVIALFFRCLGKLYKNLIIRDNFTFVSSSSPKYSIKRLSDETLATKISNGLNLKKPVISYQKKTKFLSNFLYISNLPDPADKISCYFAPITLSLSFLIAIIVLILKRDPINSISTFTLISCMSVPISLSFSINKLIYKTCKESLKNHSMISGYKAIQQFSNINTVVIDENDLFPNGSINMIGLKTFSALRLDESILCAAAVVNSIGVPMRYIFDNVIKKKQNSIPNISEVKYTDGLGLTSWANGKRILIGNRNLLKMHRVDAPPKEFELPYRKKGYEITYFAKGGELVAAFILSYTPEENVTLELERLEETGVNIIIRTSDHNITKDFIANKFNLFPGNIKILSEQESTLCKDIHNSEDSSSPSYLASKGSISSFSHLISSCIKLRTNINIASIIQVISIILGLIIVSMISIYSGGVESIGFFEILIYILFWNFATILTTKIKKI